jgi:homoserine O-succinyltransferase
MPAIERRIGPRASLVIGLVNNMPTAARRATERQFAGLLAAASQTLNKYIHVLVVETCVDQGDALFDVLRQRRPDALIVTGAEPQSVLITDEPFWPVLARLADWAADHTISTAWSCLAAHAAAFRMDQLTRSRLPQKLSGVYTCGRAADHPLLTDLPPRWLVPHSRYNNLDESDLTGKGYTILSRGAGVGVDSFIKHSGSSLFLLLQGHLEYGPDSLRNEYRRDVNRFLTGERDVYPEMPEGCFDQHVERTLMTLRKQVGDVPNLDLLASVEGAIRVAPGHPWRSPAVKLFANWLSYLATEKQARADLTHPRRAFSSAQ